MMIEAFVVMNQEPPIRNGIVSSHEASKLA